jgi:hypothetical protein
MSKLIKKVVDRHAPHISAKMTKENGYDETKHLTTKELKEYGIISNEDGTFIDECMDSYPNLKAVMKAINSGELSKDKMNDKDFVDSLFNEEEADAGA